jgi:hypothetical protein
LMNEDPVITGAIAGIAANIAKDLVNLITNLLHWTIYYYWPMAASVFVPQEQSGKFGALVLGFLADFIIGGAFGVTLYYMIAFTGKRHFILKGLGLAWLYWIFLFGILVNFHFVRITPTDIGSNLSAFLSHSALGLVAALWLKRMMRA